MFSIPSRKHGSLFPFPGCTGLFTLLTAVPAGRFYRFEHIETYSSGKVVAKSECQQSSSRCRSHRPTEDQTVLFARLSSDQRNEEIELRFSQVLDGQSVTQLSHEVSPERVRNVFSTGNVDGVRFEVKWLPICNRSPNPIFEIR